jgi:hypothetical protein
MAVLARGRIYTCGINTGYVLGLGIEDVSHIISIPTLISGLENVSKVVMGPYKHGAVVKGKLYTWGCSESKPTLVPELEDVIDVSIQNAFFSA